MRIRTRSSILVCMNTTLTIKTERNLRDAAKKTAAVLGIPLTTVINGLLRQFVREGRFTVSIDEQPTKERIAVWEAISSEAEKNPGPAFTDSKALAKYLKI